MAAPLMSPLLDRRTLLAGAAATTLTAALPRRLTAQDDAPVERSAGRHDEGATGHAFARRMQGNRIALAKTGAPGPLEHMLLRGGHRHEPWQVRPGKATGAPGGKALGRILAVKPGFRECLDPVGWIVLQEQEPWGRSCNVGVLDERVIAKPKALYSLAEQGSKLGRVRCAAGLFGKIGNDCHRLSLRRKSAL